MPTSVSRWTLVAGIAVAVLLVLAAFLVPRRAVAQAAPAPAAPAAARPMPQAPDSFLVDFETTKGRFTVKAVRAWSPLGVDRFHELVTAGFFEGARFYRVVPGFVAQFGIRGDTAADAAWMASDRRLPDEPQQVPNTRGRLTYARGGPRTRTTQLFINLGDNSRLDALGPLGEDGEPLGFPPIGEVVEGMEVADSLYGGYGEGAPRGPGPDQVRLRQEGNAYLDREFPLLDRIVKATVR